MAKVKASQKEPTTSLLDSVFYQSALRANRLEENRLKSVQFRIRNDHQRQQLQYDTRSRNAYDWAIEMRKTSRHSYPTNPSKMKMVLSTRPKTVAESNPSCCVLYGMIIGERPVLLKNFLGRKPRKKMKNMTKGENEELFRTIEDNGPTVGEDTQQRRQPSANARRPVLASRNLQKARIPQPILTESPRDSMTGETYKTFMYDNKLVTQVPIGYCRTSLRPHTSFVPHNSQMLRLENTKIPAYYVMRYKYILPPVGMFR